MGFNWVVSLDVYENSEDVLVVYILLYYLLGIGWSGLTSRRVFFDVSHFEPIGEGYFSTMSALFKAEGTLGYINVE